MSETKTLAQHLHHVFLRLQETGGEKHISSGWSSILNCKTSDTQFFTALATIVSSMDRLAATVENSALTESTISKSLEGIGYLRRFATFEMLRGNMRECQSRDFDKALTTVFFLHEFLKEHEDQSVDKTQVDLLVKELQKIIDEIKTSDIEPMLRGFLIHHLSLVQWALQNHEMFGVEGISRIFGAALIEVNRINNNLTDSAQLKESDSIISKIKTTFSKIAKKVIFVNRLSNSAEELTKEALNLLT